MLLLLPAFVNKKRVVSESEDVPAPLVCIGKAPHQDKIFASEMAHPPAGRSVPEKDHPVLAAADDLCAVADELYPIHLPQVPGQGALRVKDLVADFILLQMSGLVHRAEAAHAGVLAQAENLPT